MGVKIVRTPRRGRFATIPNALLRDTGISDRARGLLCRMLSHQDGRGPASAAELAEGTREGRDAVSKAQAELEKAGYLVRHKIRLPNGQMATEVTIYDTPHRPDGTYAPPQPDTDSQEPARPAQTHESAGDAGYGFSGTGHDLHEHESSQLTPDTDSQEPAPPAETRVPAGRTGYGFSGPYQKTREDQEKKTKKISQSAQENEASRWLRSEYEGLTDFVVRYVIREANVRAERAGKPIRHLVPYLKAMRDPTKGQDEADLADVIAAAMDAEDRLTAPEPEREPPDLTLVNGNGADRDQPSQPPILHAVTAYPAAPEPHDVDLDGHIVDAALSTLTLGGRSYQAKAARYFDARGIDATAEQINAYALELAWETPKDRDALSRIPHVAAALTELNERHAG